MQEKIFLLFLSVRYDTQKLDIDFFAIRVFFNETFNVSEILKFLQTKERAESIFNK